jgi:hypothetical protein
MKGKTMQTVPETRTPAKAFYAHLYDKAGALTKVNGTLYFVTDDDIVEVEPSMLNFLTVLGAMELSDAQRIEDLMHGGSAAIACRRAQEVA